MCRLSWAPRRSDCRTPDFLDRSLVQQGGYLVSKTSLSPEITAWELERERGGRATSSTRYPSLTTARTNESVVTQCHSAAKPKSCAPSFGSLGSRVSSNLRPRLETARRTPVAASGPNDPRLGAGPEGRLNAGSLFGGRKGSNVRFAADAAPSTDSA